MKYVNYYASHYCYGYFLHLGRKVWHCSAECKGVTIGTDQGVEYPLLKTFTECCLNSHGMEEAQACCGGDKGDWEEMGAKGANCKAAPVLGCRLKEENVKP